MRKKNNTACGFTLIEILVALFIFTILSMLLVGALHNVIGIYQRTDERAASLHQLQRTLLMMSRDIEQVVDRPIVNAHGGEEGAFIGSAQQMMFTRAGFANPGGIARQSTLQRTGYIVKENSLVRVTYNVLDQASNTKRHEVALLKNVSDVHFEYLDKDGRFLPDWPIPAKKEQKLPRAVRVYLTIPSWGKMSQLYVISAQ